MNIHKRAIAMSSYLLAFLWGIYILLSLIGWGGLVNRILFPKYRIGWGQKAAWGMAFSVGVGGVLNVTWTISPITILIYLGLGFLLWLVDIYKNRSFVTESLNNYRISWQKFQKDKLFIIGVAVILAIIFLQYAGWVYAYRFMGHDDYQGYFVYPEKMLQIGSIGIDPFNNRRIESALGGQSFLQTFTLSILKEVNFNIIDPGIALIISLGILWDYIQEKRLTAKRAVFLLFLFLFIPYPKVNITSSVTSMALFISIFTTLDWDKLKVSSPLSNAGIIAIITAAICSLKSTFIPACGLLFISSYAFYIIGAKENRKAAISEFLMASTLVVMFLLPWMISMYQSSGTLFYPILGKGYHGSVYGTFVMPSSEVTPGKAIQITISAIASIYFIALLLLGLICIFPRTRTIVGREVFLSVLISAGLGTLIVALAVGGERISVYRYPFPIIYPAIIFLMVNALSNPKVVENTSQTKTSKSWLVAMLVAGLLMGGYDNTKSGESNWQRYSSLIANIRVGLSNMPLVSDQEIARHIQMQQSIPESEPVLTRLEKPFLLNFKRNQIFVVDWPGGASLPPGIPFFKGGEAVADYLISKSIKYVAYSYKNEGGLQKKKFSFQLRPTAHIWLRTTVRQGFNFQDNLDELGKTRKRIYDDGDIFVIDLYQSVKNRGKQ
ncbi:hypothetical protein [Microseira wollei]|nr:hypothetical protein [Microseira wollei]